jgi:hypothetical protein
MKKSTFKGVKIVKGGERLYLHPYAYDPKMYPKADNKILWYRTSEFHPMGLDTIFSYREFPWVRFHLKNILDNIRFSLSNLHIFKCAIKEFFIALKKGRIKSALRFLMPNFRYYNIYPTFGVEMFDGTLGLPYTLRLEEDDNVSSSQWSIGTSDILPSDFHILMHLNWELEKIEAGTSSLYVDRQMTLISFEVWKRMMYEKGYEVRFMVDLDT